MNHHITTTITAVNYTAPPPHELTTVTPLQPLATLNEDNDDNIKVQRFSLPWQRRIHLFSDPEKTANHNPFSRSRTKGNHLKQPAPMLQPQGESREDEEIGRTLGDNAADTADVVQ